MSISTDHTPAAPPLTRVAVMAADRQIDLSIPSQIPLAHLMDDLIPTLQHALPAADFTLDGGAAWSLGPVGGQPFARRHSLADRGVRDGDLLVLQPVKTGEQFVPVIEEVSDALGRYNDTHFGSFTVLTARRMALAALVFGFLGVAGVEYAGWLHSSVTWVNGAIAVVAAFGLWVASVVAYLRWRAVQIGYALLLASLPMLAAAGITIVPPPDHAHHAGGINIVAGAALVAVFALLAYFLTRRAITAVTAATTAAVIVAGAAAVVGFGHVSVHSVSAGVIAVAALLLSMGPRITIMFSRIRPPKLPDPGDAVYEETLEEFYRPDLVAADPDLDGRDLEKRAHLANKLHTGLTIGLCAVLAGAAGPVINPGTWHAPVQVALVAIVAVALCGRRARTFIDRVQVIVLYSGALLALLIGAARTSAGYSAPAVTASVVVVTIALVVIGALAGLRGPGAQMSPVARRIGQIVEVVLVASIVPMALWAMGIYGAVRSM